MTQILVGLLLSLLAVGFGLISIHQLRGQRDRARELPKVARAAGLVHSPIDLFGSSNHLFDLFQGADRGEAHNVCHTMGADGLLERVFDLELVDVVVDEDRGLLASTREEHEREVRHRRYSCAVLEVRAVWPHLRIRPEGRFDKVLAGLGLRDIEFESDEFNRLFHVSSDDARFASDFIDPQIMDLLIQSEGQLMVEVKGRWLLVAAELLPARSVPGLLGFARRLKATSPAVLADLYPVLEPEAKAEHQ
ncbi:MAG: DUF3137 domain-containing protein [Actinomycetia bacterium]|nr:DUF3137 domain-containing protein [Actinomycetes bacterium]